MRSWSRARCLLAAHHHQPLVAEQPPASLTDVETLVLAMFQRGQRKVQIADAATGAIAPAGHRAILREEFVQRVNQRADLPARLRAEWHVRRRIGSSVQPLGPPCAGNLPGALIVALIVARPDDRALVPAVGGKMSVGALLSVLTNLPTLPI